MRVDAHQHFWSIARDDYGWLTADLEPIYRDFGPADLSPLLKEADIDKTVLVQAAPSVEETEYLLGIADATPFVGKVVGWIDCEKKDHLRHLERWAGHDKFAGIRPMIQDIPDPEWMHRPDVEWTFDAVRDLDLTFDALGLPIHIPPFLRLFEKYPHMRVVVDHGLKPEIRDRAFDDWAKGMARIVNDTSAYCKLSGLVTEAAPDWSDEDIRPYAEFIVETFGADRVMFGSDWPVLTLAGDYAKWVALAQSVVTDPGDREKIFGGTAAKFYRIHP